MLLSATTQWKKVPPHSRVVYDVGLAIPHLVVMSGWRQTPSGVAPSGRRPGGFSGICQAFSRQPIGGCGIEEVQGIWVSSEMESLPHPHLHTGR